ncbi:MAG: class I SAM-dependent methyltransferase [Cyclobacteriaceae bacterium]|nr:class I SAM-dependent methyltransferase [Cyclobacteriaceae bacterium]
MKVKEAYNIWAYQYDSNINKTRDLEAVSLKTTLSSIVFDRCLEIGCGTGKNTEWILSRAKNIVAVDFSDEMLKKAKTKIQSDRVQFIQADITSAWSFADDGKFDLATFSLVLEHIENLNRVFEELSKVITDHGYVYVGELHPFKQYTGTKARFETVDGLQVVPCFNHHISDFISAAKASGFQIVDVRESFDDPDRTKIPCILTLLFKKENRS